MLGLGGITLSGTTDGHLSSGSVSLAMQHLDFDDPIRYTGSVAGAEGTSIRGTITSPSWGDCQENLALPGEHIVDPSTSFVRR